MFSGLKPPELEDYDVPVLTLSNRDGIDKDFPIFHKMELAKVIDLNGLEIRQC